MVTSLSIFNSCMGFIVAVVFLVRFVLLVVQLISDQSKAAKVNKGEMEGQVQEVPQILKVVWENFERWGVEAGP